MADTRAEWSRTIRGWFADPVVAAWIRERAAGFLRSGTSPREAEADPTELSFGCAVVDVLEWRRAHFANSGVQSSGPKEEWGEEMIRLMKAGAHQAAIEVYSGPKLRDYLWKWNRLYLVVRVESAYRKEPWPAWLDTAVKQVRTDLRRAGLIETVAVSRSSEPTPGEIHKRILQLLHDRGKLYRSQIWSILERENLGRDALADAIDEMHAWGYVDGAPKSRKGVAILSKGRTYLGR
jgi:hypothetical protein